MTDSIKPYPMLVQFSAAWCGPCRAMQPSIDALKAKYATKIGYQKVDVDDEPELAEKHNVRSVPTLLWMEYDGKEWIEKGRMIGARSMSVLEDFVNVGLNNMSTETI